MKKILLLLLAGICFQQGFSQSNASANLTPLPAPEMLIGGIPDEEQMPEFTTITPDYDISDLNCKNCLILDSISVPDEIDISLPNWISQIKVYTKYDKPDPSNCIKQDALIIIVNLKGTNYDNTEFMIGTATNGSGSNLTGELSDKVMTELLRRSSYANLFNSNNFSQNKTLINNTRGVRFTSELEFKIDNICKYSKYSILKSVKLYY